MTDDALDAAIDEAETTRGMAWGVADLHAQWFISMLQLVSRTHPDQLQEVIWRVFDLQSAREQLDKMRADQMEMIELGNRARRILADIDQRFAAVEERLGRIQDLQSRGKQ